MKRAWGHQTHEPGRSLDRYVHCSNFLGAVIISVSPHTASIQPSAGPMRPQSWSAPNRLVLMGSHRTKLLGDVGGARRNQLQACQGEDRMLAGTASKHRRGRKTATGLRPHRTGEEPIPPCIPPRMRRHDNRRVTRSARSHRSLARLATAIG